MGSMITEDQELVGASETLQDEPVKNVQTRVFIHFIMVECGSVIGSEVRTHQDKEGSCRQVDKVDGAAINSISKR